MWSVTFLAVFQVITCAGCWVIIERGQGNATCRNCSCNIEINVCGLIAFTIPMYDKHRMKRKRVQANMTQRERGYSCKKTIGYIRRKSRYVCGVALGVPLPLSSGRRGAIGQTGGASSSRSHLDILGWKMRPVFIPASLNRFVRRNIYCLKVCGPPFTCASADSFPDPSAR